MEPLAEIWPEEDDVITVQNSQARLMVVDDDPDGMEGLMDQFREALRQAQEEGL